MHHYKSSVQASICWKLGSHTLLPNFQHPVVENNAFPHPTPFWGTNFSIESYRKIKLGFSIFIFFLSSYPICCTIWFVSQVFTKRQPDCLLYWSIRWRTATLLIKFCLLLNSMARKCVFPRLWYIWGEGKDEYFHAGPPPKHKPQNKNVQNDVLRLVW